MPPRRRSHWGDGHIRERSPGSFELRYRLKQDPVTGKRRLATKTVHCTLEEAKTELHR